MKRLQRLSQVLVDRVKIYTCDATRSDGIEDQRPSDLSLSVASYYYLYPCENESRGIPFFFHDGITSTSKSSKGLACGKLRSSIDGTRRSCRLRFKRSHEAVACPEPAKVEVPLVRSRSDGRRFDAASVPELEHVLMRDCISGSAGLIAIIDDNRY